MHAQPNTTTNTPVTQGQRMERALQNSVNISEQHQYTNSDTGLLSSGLFPKANQKLVSSMVPERFTGLTFDNCIEFGLLSDDVITPLADYSRSLYLGSRRNLVLYGPCGSGKSLIAAAIFQSVAIRVRHRNSLQDALECGTADNFTWFNCADLIAAIKDPTSPASVQVWSAYLGVLDDLDKHPAGGWSDKLYRLIDLRMCRNRLLNLITTNLSPVQLINKYGDSGKAIVDRFRRTDSLVIHIKHGSIIQDKLQSWFNRVDEMRAEEMDQHYA